jgi:hypothetical protein
MADRTGRAIDECPGIDDTGVKHRQGPFNPSGAWERRMLVALRDHKSPIEHISFGALMAELQVDLQALGFLTSSGGLTTKGVEHVNRR